MDELEDHKAGLVISIKGEIVDSNFESFCESLRAEIASLSYKLETENDFNCASDNVKSLKLAEESLKEAKDQALQQAEDIQRLFAAIDLISDQARSARLDLSRQIETRKAELKAQIIEEAVNSLDVSDREKARLRIERATKGRRIIETIQWAAKNEACTISDEIKQSRKMLATHRNEHGSALTPDAEALEWMSLDALRIELSRRVERASAEAEARRLIAEARSKSNSESKPAPKGGIPSPEVAQDVKQGESEGEELDRFIKTLQRAFAPVKTARLSLKHQANIDLAQGFADALSPAYAALVEEVSK